MNKILAIETSCDDCAAAIVDDHGHILSDVIYSQLEQHKPYGGVVPEIGSRAHIEQIRHVVKQACVEAKLNPKDINFVAATFAPGLLGPLMVGAQFAKGFALARDIKLIAVHHIDGHIMSGFGDHNFPAPPFLSLIVSGGHSAIYQVEKNYEITCLGQTLDDAAGETLDKVGRALGFAYPAGKLIDNLALTGNKTRFDFPIAMRKESHLNLSFSGLKTKALETIKKLSTISQQDRADLCASLQEAICLALTERLEQAVKKTNIKNITIGGGVAANSRLRAMLTHICDTQDLSLYLPPLNLCTDNAVMIGRAALIKIRNNQISNYDTQVLANLPIEQKYLLNI